MPRLCFYKSLEDAPLFVVRLGASQTRIGRTDDCDVVLPDEAVSRLHCVIDAVPGGWRLTDKSRNGLLHNGQRAREVLLAHGDRLALGSFLAVLDLNEEADAAVTERAQPERRDEELLEAHGSGLALREAWLIVHRGPSRGKRFRLRGNRLGVGGAGSRVDLGDPALVPDHFRLRLSHGRAMVEPGAGAVFLGPTRVRDIVPVHAGEDLRAGDSELRVEWIDRREELRAEQFGELVGVSEAMSSAFGMLRRMAAHHAPVLLIGESGTGKELAARAVHDASPRASRPFVALNCGAITPSLFESELFGHERGAFTGASERRDGAFQRADGGTLFLDEVGELPEDAQAKLLRALESGEVRRVGGSSASFPDVRIVAATNRNLAEDARTGRFRGDLYFRLAVLAVRIPPLRERPEDIGPIAQAIARRLHPGLRLTPDAMDALRRWPWPGNARELRNVITRAWVLGGESLVDARHLVFNPLEGMEGMVAGGLAAGTTPAAVAPSGPSRASAGEGTLDAAEREVVLSTLRKNRGNRTHTARELGIARSSLLCKLKRWGIADEGVT
jgi:DNA-binding NtrC family response regulator